MNLVVARRVKNLLYMVAAETIKSQAQETFENAGGEENWLELRGNVGWFSEFVDGNDCEGFPAVRQV